MKKIQGLTLVGVIMCLSFTNPLPTSWTLDGAHSQLEFSVSLFNISDIHGTFKLTKASIEAPNDDFTNATVYLEADMNSIDTDNDDRDKHLRTADFFDVTKYPVLTFRSQGFKKENGKYKVVGELTMHGITKRVMLDATGATVIHPVTKQTVAGFRVSTTIRRSDFGISPSSPTEMLSDEVRVSANLQFTRNQ
ncbi:MAG: YceI family protein [Chitinophagaceae bacterium]|nr:YceI family protein [Chitinophagaceae bacterium]